MGQASMKANALELATGLPRFRIPEQAVDPADPIKKVDEAVRAVLAELKGPSRSRKESDCQVVVDRLFSLRHAEPAAWHPDRSARPLDRRHAPRQRAAQAKGITIRLGGLGEPMGTARGEWGFSIAADRQCWGRSERCGGPFSRTRVPGSSSSPRWSSWRAGSWTGKVEGPCSSRPRRHLRSGSRARLPASGRHRPRNPARSILLSSRWGMNLLVVEPAGKSISWIKQLAMLSVSPDGPGPEALRVEDR